MTFRIKSSLTAAIAVVALAASPAQARDCSKRISKTGGAVIGAVGGAVLGKVIAGGTAGTLIGAAAGGVAGHEIARKNKNKCRYERRR
ncbi:glycine zipper 2TM domain-containing protein [Novosphingobium sp. EMRT-2]|uniref:glycine zipper 2TM domain-containing protein n=1 Tax=Novosphingobium sp. EMRT-2 TaxID=2571749 RepID=UPI0010BD27A4|nr:glycine zipper 2TM domain-containing protein [Novosphingobium sp. EMRT-2]QCI94415.1 glycine zipper 2TM domain-containing protein [Novosphingobium sp. EMRT-2]